MSEIDFLSPLHKSTKRDYISRVIDKSYPKEKAAELAKKFDFDYWDGDRKICYGGYHYIEGRWEGPYESFDRNGKLLAKGRYKKNLQCGLWVQEGKMVEYPPC